MKRFVVLRAQFFQDFHFPHTREMRHDEIPQLLITFTFISRTRGMRPSEAPVIESSIAFHFPHTREMILLRQAAYSIFISRI